MLDNTVKSGAQFYPFDRIYRHHCLGNFRVQFVKYRFTQPDRNICRLNIDPRANRVSGFTQRLN